LVFFIFEIVIGWIYVFFRLFFQNLGTWLSLIVFVFVIIFSHRFIKHFSTTFLIVVTFLYSFIYWCNYQDNLYISCDGTNTFINEDGTYTTSPSRTRKFSFVGLGEKYVWVRDEFFFLPHKQVLDDISGISVSLICQDFNKHKINCNNTLPYPRIRKSNDTLTEYQTNVDRKTGQIFDSITSIDIDEKGVERIQKVMFSGNCSKTPEEKMKF
jgi:hypothetical protein